MEENKFYILLVDKLIWGPRIQQLHRDLEKIVNRQEYGDL